MKIVTETEESIARSKSIRRLHDYTFRRFIRFPKSMGYAVDTGVDGDLYTIRRNDQQRAKGKGEDRNSFDARLSRLSLIARRARSTKTGRRRRRRTEGEIWNLNLNLPALSETF